MASRSEAWTIVWFNSMVIGDLPSGWASNGFAVGRMFWLRWKTFSGSTASLSAVSRASTAAG